MAWGSGPDRNTIDGLASRVMARPHVQARVAEIRREILAKTQAAAVISHRERRELLASTARSVRKGLTATHGERIRALELDARLAGELTEQVQVSGELNVKACVLALMGSASAVPVPEAGAGEDGSSKSNGRKAHANGSGNGHSDAAFEAIPLPDAGPMVVEEEEN